MAKFKTSARAVDMLGRQQIAGVPTALNEVLKNAHDAYASHVRADLSVDRRCLLIRDDGVGMTPDHFEQYWLTLATDSKYSGAIVTPPAGLPTRAVMGAKGIGRLAIAVVGPHCFIATRSRQKPDVVTCCLINWNVFDIPGVDLSEIEIPMLRISPAAGVTGDTLETLTAQSKASIEQLREARLESPSNDIAAKAIEAALRSYDTFDAGSLAALARLPGPTLSGNGFGTWFYISPSDVESMWSEDGHRPDPEFAQTLTGFADTMTPNHKPPELEAQFWVHSTSLATPRDLLSSEDFLTSDEFRAADHSVIGRFDELGFFEGEITVYGAKSALSMNCSGGKTPRCGPFSFALAIIQPRAAESKMESVAHDRLLGKLKELGGIYVYRNGIRVLPYGRPSVDWLEIEEHRSKQLSRSFYSHRRMFGAVGLDSDLNRQLAEKAGREGFQQNAAYRDLRRVLQAFLRESATRYFVRGGEESETYVEHVAAVRQQMAARVAQARRNKEIKAVLDSVTNAYVRIADGEARAAVQLEIKKAQAALDRNDWTVDAPVVQLERARSAVDHLLDDVTVYPPPGVAVDVEGRRDMASYRRLLGEFSDWCTAAIGELESAYRERLNIEGIAPAVRTRHLAEHTVDVGSRKVARSLSELGVRASALRVEAAGVLAQLTAGEHDSTVQVADLISSVDRAFTGFARSIDSVRWTREGKIILTTADELEALEEETADLRYAVEDSADLVQLGMTVAVVDHEFRHIIGEMRALLTELRVWGTRAPRLQELAGSLTDTFNHLDSYLSLLTPLQRRARLRPVVITGDSILRFVAQLFQAELSDRDVELTASAEFAALEIVGQRSTWYPIFVNLVDNALYWVGQSPPPRKISLSANGVDQLAVEDSGPGVLEEDRERIFAPRFTLKPGGRGLGLAICRESLRGEGWQIHVEDSNALGGAKMVLTRESGDGSGGGS